MLVKKKRFIGLMLCMVMIVNMFAFQCIGASAEESVSTNDYGLVDRIQDGNIFHCNNTYFKTITDRLPEIAAQGFSAVQVSPIQGNKQSINSGAYFCDWSFYYQPVNFKIGNELGSKEDFKELCEQADKYGIKVIVDIVSNHMAQSDDGRSGSLSEQIEEPYNDEQYYHGIKRDANDSARQFQVTYNVGGLPDLDTSNPTVQKWVYDLLEECVSLGADGFRFDTAKHIETAQDGDLASDFWENTAVKIQEKYEDLYVYGEVIDLKDRVSISAYTDVMNVTDAGYGIKVRSSINKGNLSNLSTTAGVYDAGSGVSAGQGLLWVESHDEFLSGTTSKMSEEVLIKAYAAIATRKDNPTLFFPRPVANNVFNSTNWDALLGEYTDTWLSKEIREVNLFKNAYVGQSEKLSSFENKYYIVQRGNDGACIVNIGTDTVINVPTTLADGTYRDQISGNNFNVKNGYITGKMATSGVAVVYNKEALPNVTVEVNGSTVKENDNLSFYDEEITLTVNLKNAEKGTYTIAGNDAVEFAGVAELRFGKEVYTGKAIPVVITATGNGKTVTRTYVFNKKDKNEDVVIYFDAPAKAFYCSTEDNPLSAGVPYVLAKDNEETLGDYPGHKMEKVESDTYKNLYKCELDKSTVYVKFNDGIAANDESDDAHTIPPTEFLYGDASLLENRVKGGLEICGSMLWSKGKLIDVTADGKAYEQYTEKLEVNSKYTEAQTDTDKFITIQQEVKTTRLYGDIDKDEAVTMLDVVSLQKHIAQLTTLDENSAKAGDVDGKNSITMEDVVLLQKHIAKLIKEFPQGEKLEIVIIVEITTDADYLGSDTESDVLSDTETETESDADTVTDTESDLPSDSDTEIDTDEELVLYFENTLEWDVVYAHYWEDKGAAGNTWPGEEMEAIGDNLYKLVVSDEINANRIIFNNGGNKVQTVNLHITEFGATFTPTEQVGTDVYGNTLYTGTWDGVEAEYDP